MKHDTNYSFVISKGNPESIFMIGKCYEVVKEVVPNKEEDMESKLCKKS